MELAFSISNLIKGYRSAHNLQKGPEPVFLNLLRSPGIDSQPGGQVRQPYLLDRPAKLHRPAESIPRIPSLGSLNVYKYGLCGLLNPNYFLNTFVLMYCTRDPAVFLKFSSLVALLSKGYKYDLCSLVTIPVTCKPSN
jgi:hypothetical protein